VNKKFCGWGLRISYVLTRDGAHTGIAPNYVVRILAKNWTKKKHGLGWTKSTYNYTNIPVCTFRVTPTDKSLLLRMYLAWTSNAALLPFSPDPARGFAALALRQPDLDSFLQADPYRNSFRPDWCFAAMPSSLLDRDPLYGDDDAQGHGRCRQLLRC